MDFERDETAAPVNGKLVDEAGLHYREAENGHVYLGDVARNLMGKSGQYGSRYVQDIPGYPNLAADLRVEGEDQYSFTIHPEDIEPFLTRYFSWRTVMAREVVVDGERRLPTEDEIRTARGVLAAIGVEVE